MPTRKIRNKRYFRNRHGRAAEEVMAEPSTPFQRKALVKLGMSYRGAASLNKGEASLEIQKRRGM